MERSSMAAASVGGGLSRPASATSVASLLDTLPASRMPAVSRPDVIRVILADDHLVVRAGLKALLGATKDIEVVGEATNGRDAISLIQRLAPDVAVMDLDMPQMDGISATKELAKLELPTR